MAVQARVPIVPVVIANYNDIYSTKAKRFIPGNVNIKGKENRRVELVDDIWYQISNIFIWYIYYIVLPPVLTSDIEGDSASIEKLSVRIRESMLTTLREISPPTKDE